MRQCFFFSVVAPLIAMPLTDQQIHERMAARMAARSPIERRVSEVLRFIGEVRGHRGFSLCNVDASRLANRLLMPELANVLFASLVDDDGPAIVEGDPAVVADLIVSFERIRDQFTKLMIELRAVMPE